MIAGLALAVALAFPGDTGILAGTVRASGSGEPVPGALVEVVDGRRGTWADSAGDYRLELAQGTWRLRVWHPGYEPRTLEVMVGTDSLIRLDISLTAHPVLLTEVSVVARKDSSPAAAPGAWIGSRTFTSERLHSDPTSDGADVAGTVAAAPGVAVAPEMPAGLHVRGGSADQNLVLVDGVPLYNPDHAGGALGALNPDALGSVTVHAGVAPPRFGDALSGVVALETGEPGRAAVVSRGAAGALSVGETIGGPLPVVPGTFLVSVRHSTADLLAAREPSDGAASFADLLARADVDIGRGSLEVLSLASSDHLGFDARPAAAASVAGAGTPVADSGGTGTAARDTLGSWNAFHWSTSTQAVVWRSDRLAPARVEVRAWRTWFGAGATWAADSGPVRLASALTRTGFSADASRRLGSGLAAAGVAAERFRTRYALSQPAGAAPAAPDSALAVFGSAAVLVSGYVQGQVALGTRWIVSLGARARLVTGRSRALEPRVSVRFAAAPWLALSAGYARMHQTVQSLRNEESALDPLVGIALPVTAGSHGVPRAHGDQLAVAAEARLDAHTAITLDAYRRALGGLVLVAPATAQPFVMQRFACGAGRASGATLLLERDASRLFGRVALAVAASSRRVAAHGYRPSFGGAHSLTAAAGWRLDSATTLRAAWWSIVGRQTSEVEGEMDWVPYNLLRGAGAFDGSPQHIAGAVSGSRLPAYARLDLGVRREWHGRILGRAAGLTGSLTLRNALGRANALGIVLPDHAHTVKAIPMLPRTLTAGLEWSY